MKELLSQPWPWYIAGPLIGLLVPLLLLIGNKSFGVSSSLRHFCAMCVPAKIPFFKYEWRKSMWNILFVVGIVFGGAVGATLIPSSQPVEIADETKADLYQIGITNYDGYAPEQIFGTDMMATSTGLIFLVFGGFLVGFGTRYAGGCTSGHSIFGLATMSWVSLVATICFFVGGIFSTHFILPNIL